MLPGEVDRRRSWHHRPLLAKLELVEMNEALSHLEIGERVSVTTTIVKEGAMAEAKL
jgi:hypothetical protein